MNLDKNTKDELQDGLRHSDENVSARCCSNLCRDTADLRTEEKCSAGCWRILSTALPVACEIIRIGTISGVLQTVHHHPLSGYSATHGLVVLLYFMVCLLSIAALVRVYCIARTIRCCKTPEPDGIAVLLFYVLCIVNDIIFLTTAFVYIFHFWSACLSMGSPKSIFYFLAPTKQQVILLFLSLSFMLTFFSKLMSFAKTCAHQTTNGVRSVWHSKNCIFVFVKNAVTSAIVAISASGSLITFLLYADVICRSQLLFNNCVPTNLTVFTSAHVHYTVDVIVVFPDPSVGISTRRKVVDLHYQTFLIHQLDSNLTKCGKTVRKDNDTVDESNCHLEPFDAFAHAYQSSKLHSSDSYEGIIFKWPCEVTMKFQTIRKGVECFYRIKVQFDDQWNLVYNYDYVYTVPELAELLDQQQPQWNMLAHYSAAHQLISSSSEAIFQDFREVFVELDYQLSQVELDFPYLDLIETQPHTMHITCNRSCFCYECVADMNVKRHEHCVKMCPMRELNDYRNHLKDQFCKSNKPDRCRTEWWPVAKIAAESDYKDLLSTQSPPNISIRIGNSEYPVGFDAQVFLPTPNEREVPVKSCEQSRGAAISVWVLGLLLFLALLGFSTWHSRKQKVDKTTRRTDPTTTSHISAQFSQLLQREESNEKPESTRALIEL